MFSFYIVIGCIGQRSQQFNSNLHDLLRSYHNIPCKIIYERENAPWLCCYFHKGMIVFKIMVLVLDWWVPVHSWVYTLVR